MSRKFFRRFSYLFLLLSTVLVLTACNRFTQPPDSPQPSPTLPVSPTLAAPTPTQTTPVPHTFAILAERGWDSTALFVRPGQQLEITATGSWNDGLEDTPHGPGGTDKYEPESFLASAPIGALLGRIGDNPPFEIGEHTIMTAEFGGELLLSINDHPEALSDNTGTLEVSVSLGPEPAIPAQLLTNELDGYRVLVPAGYQAVIYKNSICLTLNEAWMMACHVANAFIEVSDAGGRTLNQVADEVAADANPDILVKRTNLAISGIEAIQLDDIYTYDVLRKVVIVYDDRIYTLTFVPWNDTLEDFARLENLYNTIIHSLTFLPQLEAPLPAPATPDLSTMSIRSLSSTSPDRQWRAEALLATFVGEFPADYARLTVSRTDGSASWLPFEQVSDYGGLGTGYISEFYWSAEGFICTSVTGPPRNRVDMGLPPSSTRLTCGMAASAKSH